MSRKLVQALPTAPSVVTLAATVFATLPVRANDFIVDAAGTVGTFPTVTAAMLVAAPRDRILVAPGVYPAFQFERGVEVIGLGARPEDVTIARVDFHVSIPNQNYDAVLSNLTVCGSSPLDAISISGNELARGTFLIDGVHTCGGVFLAGEPDLQLIVQNSKFEPAPGGGFLGAAFDFGGGMAELVNVSIVGWDAHLAIAAGHGLRVSEEATLRATACSIVGGTGTTVEGSGLAHGGDGITSAPWPNPVTLELAGGTTVRGGDGAGTAGAGGAGASVNGTPLSLTVGFAAVQGGLGHPAGVAWSLDAPISLGFDPTLALDGGNTPGGSGPGERSVRWVAGDLLAVTSDPTIAATSQLTLTGELEPALADFGGVFGALPPRVLAIPQLARIVPGLPPPPTGPRPRLWLVFQARFGDPVTGSTRHSNPVAVRVDG